MQRRIERGTAATYHDGVSGFWPDGRSERHEAVFGHRYERAGMGGDRGEIWGYTDALSYAPGATVRLCVSSTAERYRFAVLRDGASARTVLEQEVRGARWQDTPDQCSVLGCGWEPSVEFRIGKDWPSGAYRVTFTAEGRDGSELRAHHLFIVRPTAGREAGAHSAGRGHGLLDRVQHLGRLESLPGHHRAKAQPVRDDRQPRAPVVPRFRGSARERAARAARDCSPARGGAALSAHGVGVRERLLQQIRLGRMGELRPAFLSLGRARGLTRWISRASTSCISIRRFSTATTASVFVGHDEYWTWEMRDAVDRYVERGGRAARFAGNFMWQTRLERDGKAQVCYKYRARAEDPVYESADPSRTTGSWEASEIGRPGALTFGLNATNGLYAGWGLLRTARRPRLSGVSARALGLRRDRPVLRRLARRRGPCLRL